jgi:hypothetical protein
VTGTKKDSEVWFERYAAEHGLEGGDEHEPDLGGGDDAPKPDYRVTRGALSAIVEVKEFETSALHERSKEMMSFTLDAETVYRTMRNTMEKAAKRQLRPYADLGEPLIVCLANAKNIWIDFGSDAVLEAMNGDGTVSVPVDPTTGATAGEASYQFGRNGSFVDRHRYVSAVMTLHRGADDFYFVRVYESRWAALGNAVPVQRDLFNGPRDEFWAIDRETGTIAPGR